MAKPRLNCAVYTRKSSDEGLEQSFNSLDAQREACEAYISSQKHEGWQVIKTTYDDGGYSGGSMDRPALQKLMGDIEAGRINVIVVYKVDRLTRSLADFAKLVELFDKHGVSFVSVTQQFNTTTSMGRLTLNVLLSFAQFEREVTGERIRDKIAASKAKGMWMGGVVPLGYEPKDRTLIPIPEEASRVRYIYERYLALGSVRELQVELEQNKIFSKSTVSKAGRKMGGKAFGRGALYALLQNPLYIGQISHKGKIHTGQHEAIVPDNLWQAVQKQLADNRVEHKTAILTGKSLLTGLLYAPSGERLTPTNTVRCGKRYRYYVLASTTRVKSKSKTRLPAGELEKIVLQKLGTHFKDNNTPENHDLLTGLNGPDITFQRATLNRIVNNILIYPAHILIKLKSGTDITIDYRFATTGPYQALTTENEGTASDAQKQTLLKTFLQGYVWRKRLFEGADIETIAKNEGKSATYITRLINFSFMAPDITSAILKGDTPASATRERLVYNVPLNWGEQRALFRRMV